jgi:sugar transferase (PEP-CTERM/EpsH1 system associated)
VRILFVAARFPAPARQGFQVRAYHQIRLLAPRHRITLVAFATSPPSPADRADIARYCADIVTVPLIRAEMTAGLVRGLFGRRPLQTALYDTAPMRRAIGRLLAERRHDLVHVQLARMARHVETAPLPRVVDLIDALSLNMARRAERDRGPARFAAALEAKRLRRYERELCRTFDAATVVAPVDRDAIGDFPTLGINPNGVALDDFAFVRSGHDPNRVAFTGNLGYFPNVDAVEWFVRDVLPRVRRVRPQTTFVAAGARPHRRLRALASTDGVVLVQGDVPDVGSVLTRAAVSVAPMHAGSGQPLKVLEAMACGTPVVATPVAASGIAAEPGRHLLIGDDAASFAAHVLRMLETPAFAADIAVAARGLVEQRYTWERSVTDLETIYRRLVR